MSSGFVQQNTTPLGASVDSSAEIINRIGHLTRTLHDSLNGLGLNKILEQVALDIPDARDRLNYVARMTEQAAERVLNATDEAIPLQADLGADAKVMESSWMNVLSKPSLKSEYNLAVVETLRFLSNTEQKSLEAKAILIDIMMAQDFQDLTGQIIKKITALANDMEKQLLQVLIDFSPTMLPKSGDVIKENINTSILLANNQEVEPSQSVVEAENQSQVDDLLDSLGF